MNYGYAGTRELNEALVSRFLVIEMPPQTEESLAFIFGKKHSDEYREDLYGNSDAFIGAMNTHMRSLHMSSLYTAMNELSNHDHSRFLTRTHRRVGRISYAGAEAASQGINCAVMREAVAIQMTWIVQMDIWDFGWQWNLIRMQTNVSLAKNTPKKRFRRFWTS